MAQLKLKENVHPYKLGTDYYIDDIEALYVIRAFVSSGFSDYIDNCLNEYLPIKDDLVSRCTDHYMYASLVNWDEIVSDFIKSVAQTIDEE